MRNNFTNTRYNSVPVPSRPTLNAYPCGSELITDIEFGRWVPAGSYFAIPGDKIRVGQNAFIRTIPLVTVPFTGFHVKFVTFFTALRNLDDDADKIITGFDEDEKPFEGSFDSWKISKNEDVQKWSNYDYFGFQTMTKGTYDKIPEKCKPADYWRKNLYFIYNEWLREPKLQDAIDEDSNNDPIYANYGRDRYTAASLTPQLGDEATIPLEASNSVTFPGELDWEEDFADMIVKNLSGYTVSVSGMDFNVNRGSTQIGNKSGSIGYQNSGGGGQPSRLAVHDIQAHSPGTISDTYNQGSVSTYSQYGILGEDIPIDIAEMKSQLLDFLSDNSVSINGGMGINDTRLAFARQLLNERLNVTGSRYNEFLRANYGIAPTDETLQRPVFLGSSVAPVLVDEVTQMSESNTTPLGDIAGKGVSMNTSYTHSYTCKEFGIVQTLMCIVPDVYYSDGIPKQFTYKNKIDFFNPIFQVLGEQEVKNSEIYVNGTSGVDGDDDAWGFEMLYEELKSPERRISGSFRDYLDTYTLARHFSERPVLNGDFIKCIPNRDNLNRIFVAIDSDRYKPFHVHIYNDIRALRPLIRYPIPATLKGM